jgi:hypothetical protein
MTRGRSSSTPTADGDHARTTILPATADGDPGRPGIINATADGDPGRPGIIHATPTARDCAAAALVGQ